MFRNWRFLHSTVDYGPDAHKFASCKPISLFSGSHFLHLLEKRGCNAKIDFLAARKELNLRSVKDLRAGGVGVF